MRRALAILVMLVFGGMLLVPAFADLGPSLPACCRASGSHHCTGKASAAPGDGFRDAARQCPYSHATLLPRSARTQAPAAVPAPHFANAPRAEAGRMQPAAPAFGSQSPRAPPALSSL